MELKEIKICQCVPFCENPFLVKDDAGMEMLIQSVKDYGVMYPIMVRPKEGRYEIVSGHRRVYACEKAGIEMIPAFIHEMGRDEAIIRMVDSNLHRDGLLPSEKAFAYKMKLEAVKHQGVSGQSGQKLSRDEIAVGESGRMVQRYIRLTNLEKSLLELVDQGRIALTPAVELSYLLPEEQQEVVYFYETYEMTPSYSQAVRLRKLSQEKVLSDDLIYEIMSEEKPNQKEYLKLSMDRYEKYFDPFDTPRKMEDFIAKALEHYTRYLERQRSLEER